MTYWLSQYPSLAKQGIAGYHNIYPNNSFEGTLFGGIQGEFILPGLSASNTSASLEAAIAPLISHIGTTWPGLFSNESGSFSYPSFYSWWALSNGPDNAGADIMVGSRLLDTEALTGNLAALKTALKGAIAPGFGLSGQANFVSGEGVWNAKPRGGSDAVNPAWRKALVHFGKNSQYKIDSLEVNFGVLTHVFTSNGGRMAPLRCRCRSRTGES
jgi:hypothetical protein